MCVHALKGERRESEKKRVGGVGEKTHDSKSREENLFRRYSFLFFFSVLYVPMLITKIEITL